MAVTFEDARAVVDRALSPSWSAELGELHIAADGLEDATSWHVIAGAREYLEGADRDYELLDAPALLVDKLTGCLERVVVVDNLERLGAMRPVVGGAPRLHA